MICIPIVARSNAEALHVIRLAASEPADIMEIRLDLIGGEPDVEALVAASRIPVLATCRSRREGGGFGGTPEQCAALLDRAAAAGAAYIDAETGVAPLLARRRGLTTIASWHDLDGVPDDLEAKVGRLAALPCDWVKFAVMAHSQIDNVRVFDAIAACPKPCIGIAMGEFGLPSRVLGLAHGSRLAFGRPEAGMESAAGQPTARELEYVYRIRDITRSTAVYGLIGDPVRQSPGYKLHNLAFSDAGIDAVYIPFRCVDLDTFIASVAGRLNVKGLSVTMPWKLQAFSLAQAVGKTALLAGAANTLILRSDGWHAENTDFTAVAATVVDAARRNRVELSQAPALVIGAGGAARAIGAALASIGCNVTLAGRRMEHVAKLASDMGWSATTIDEAADGAWRIVANSTPVGMYPHADETLFPARSWKRGMIAFEAIYHPRRTRFLREAGEAGAYLVDGMAMFASQAAEQFRLWTGRNIHAPAGGE